MFRTVRRVNPYKALGTSAQLWLNLQNRYDVEIATREIVISLDPNQKIYMDREEVTLNQLYSKLRAIPAKTRPVSIQADRRVPYGMVMKAISVARKSGFYDFAFDVVYEEDLVR